MAMTPTANQIVAANLRRARKIKGWNQEVTVKRLAPYLGGEISRANYSLMETSHKRDERIRNFTADDLLAFSRAFDLPVLYFLLPPVEDEKDEPFVKALVDQGVDGVPLREYLDRVWPTDFDLGALTDPQPDVGTMEKRLYGLSVALGFDLTDRIRKAVTSQALRAVQSAVRPLLDVDGHLADLKEWLVESIRRIDGAHGAINRAVEPVWEEADAALTREEREDG